MLVTGIMKYYLGILMAQEDNLLYLGGSTESMIEKHCHST